MIVVTALLVGCAKKPPEELPFELPTGLRGLEYVEELRQGP